MIEFDGIRFNDVVSSQLINCLGAHDPTHGNLTHDQVANRVTRPIFMSAVAEINGCLLYTSPSPRDQRGSRMPSSA